MTEQEVLELRQSIVDNLVNEKIILEDVELEAEAQAIVYEAIKVYLGDKE